MTAIVIVAKVLVTAAACWACYLVLRFGDEQDEQVGRVRSDPPQNTYVSADTLRKLRDS